MIRMLIVGCSFGIHSERRLCEEVQLNLAYRWSCRLGLEDPVPDHSTFSKNRHGRFRDSDLFRHVFEGVLRRCMSEGLVGGEGFAIDASIIKADASRQRGVDASDDTDWCDPKVATRPVREYIAALDGQTIQSGTPATKISLTDPASRWTAAQGGPAFYAYSANYLIDLDVTEKPYAAPIHPIVRSPVQYMKRFGIMPAHLKKFLPIDSPAVIAKRLRCLSPISTAS